MCEGGRRALSLKDDSFDLGIIHMALHHFPNYARSAGEVCRVSREVISVDIIPNINENSD
jgi:ubiquinone/menaquinone biosynthesis C-methylase UbiE